MSAPNSPPLHSSSLPSVPPHSPPLASASRRDSFVSSRSPSPGMSHRRQHLDYHRNQAPHIAAVTSLEASLISHMVRYIGASKWSLPTPCLCIDLERFQSSIDRLHSFIGSHQKKIRPHAKSHKCAEIARRQLSAPNTSGICVAKLSEGWGLAKLGIRGLLITSPVVTAFGLSMLSELIALDPGVILVVDSYDGAEQLAKAVDRINNKKTKERGVMERGSTVESNSSVQLNILIDIDGGMGRTGVKAGDAAKFALKIHSEFGSRLRIRGVQCYIGHIQHIKDWDERRNASLTPMREAEKVYLELKKFISTVDIFTGGGTGTADIDVEIESLTEIQAGSYCLMDAEYMTIESKENRIQFMNTLPPLTLLTTVISANHLPTMVTVDAGLKAIYKDGPPPVAIVPDPSIVSVHYDFFGDEHGRISVSLPNRPGSTLMSTRRLSSANIDPTKNETKETSPPTVSERIMNRLMNKLPLFGVSFVCEFIVSHCDPTVNLHEVIFVTEKDVVVDLWPLDLRGKHF